MHRYFFNRYTALAIGTQFLIVLAIWIVAFAVSPAGDRLFSLIFYFYLPPIYLISTVLNLKGESGMIAGGVYGFVFGILLYGFVVGFVISYLKRRK
jgi:hypothetical protein